MGKVNFEVIEERTGSGSAEVPDDILEKGYWAVKNYLLETDELMDASEKSVGMLTIKYDEVV